MPIRAHRRILQPAVLTTAFVERFVDRPETPDTGVSDGIHPIVDMGAHEWRPPTPGDVNGAGAVNVDDMLIVLGGWGGRDGDVNMDGITDVNDLLIVLANWGSAP